METVLNFVSLKEVVEKNREEKNIHLKNRRTNTMVDIGQNTLEIYTNPKESLKIIYDKTESEEIVWLKLNDTSLRLPTKASLYMINAFLNLTNINSKEKFILTVKDMIK